MALADNEIIDVRRHLNVPFSGLSATGLTMGIRTIFQAGQLEFYMKNLQPYEESVLTGRPYGKILIYGTVVALQTVTATINGTPVTYAVLAADAAATYPLQAVANGLAAAINVTGIGGVFAGGYQILPNAPQGQLPAQGVVTLIASTTATFTLTSSSTGAITAYTSANGSVIPFPNLTFADQNGVSQTLNGYINICNYLEANIVSASGNLALLSAGSGAAILRPYEIKQRIQLYDYWRTRMGRMLSVGPDAWGFRGNTGSNQGGASA